MLARVHRTSVYNIEVESVEQMKNMFDDWSQVEKHIVDEVEDDWHFGVVESDETTVDVSSCYVERTTREYYEYPGVE